MKIHWFLVLLSTSINIIFITVCIVITIYSIKQINAFTIASENTLVCKTPYTGECDYQINDLLPIPTPSISYDYDTARFCLDLISRIYLMYMPESNYTKLILPPSLTLIKDIVYLKKSNIPNIGFICSDNNNNIYIIFRGTLQIEEWIKDLTMDQKTTKINKKNEQLTLSPSIYNTKFKKLRNYPPSNVLSGLSYSLTNTSRSALSSSNKILIHRGFLEIYNDIKEDIMTTILSLNIPKTSNIFISGHSLGASLATIASFDLAFTGFNIYSYVFASPKVGNIEFAKSVTNNNNQKCFFRFTNECDVIPAFPFSVQGNIKNINEPYIFMPVGTNFEFNANNKSLINNHMIPIYIQNLPKINK